MILNCARRTSTVSSCAFREQEDDQAALSHSTTDCEGDCKVISAWGNLDWSMKREAYGGTTLKMALVLETYTKPSAPSMRLNKPPFPPL